MGYREATKEEIKLASAGKQQWGHNLEQYRAFAKKFYDRPVSRLYLIINSEYNDCTYDNKLSAALAYDSNGKVIHPKEGKEREVLTAVHDLPFSEYETNDPLEDVVIPLDTSNLTLYIKED